MEIQHTQDQWSIYSSNADQHKYITDFRITCGDNTICSFTHFSKEYSEDFDRQTPEANAALICDAVNNTAGQGIDPNAVAGILKAAKNVVKELEYIPYSRPALKELVQAIKAAKIK